MYKSDIICVVQENKMLAAMKMIISYSYLSSGAHSSSTTPKAAQIKFYGINKGVRTQFASAYLDTVTGYLECTPASAMLIGLPTNEYAYICFEIDDANSDFYAIHGQPQFVFTTQGSADDPSSGLKIKVTRP